MVLIELFLAFLKIGAFTFGGGYAMIAMIQAEAERHGWLTPEELVDFVRARLGRLQLIWLHLSE